jgi:Acetyltransferase (GNAT) domain
MGEIGLNERPDWPGPHKVEVGWELHPSVWGQGLAAEGGRAALRYGPEVVGLERIISAARADNAASRRVMEKCGLDFQEELTFKDAQVDVVRHRRSQLAGQPDSGQPERRQPVVAHRVDAKRPPGQAQVAWPPGQAQAGCRFRRRWVVVGWPGVVGAAGSRSTARQGRGPAANPPHAPPGDAPDTATPDWPDR